MGQETVCAYVFGAQSLHRSDLRHFRGPIRSRYHRSGDYANINDFWEQPDGFERSMQTRRNNCNRIFAGWRRPWRCIVSADGGYWRPTKAVAMHWRTSINFAPQTDRCVFRCVLNCLATVFSRARQPRERMKCEATHALINVFIDKVRLNVNWNISRLRDFCVCWFYVHRFLRAKEKNNSEASWTNKVSPLWRFNPDDDAWKTTNVCSVQIHKPRDLRSVILGFLFP